MGDTDNLVVFTGRANQQLARKIGDYLGTNLGRMQISPFSDDEIYVKIDESIRGKDVFLVQPTNPPVNEHLMEMLIIIDACKRASAQRITAVIPYYGYARQDRKDKPRAPITAKLIANLITTAGADRVLTMDLHVDQIQGFFDIQVDHLYAFPVILDYFRKVNIDNLVVLSPDVGGLRRARAYAKGLDAPLAIVDKRRPTANSAEVMDIVGDVAAKNVLIVDDMIDTGGTLLAALDVLLERSARAVYAACTHAVFSGDAVERLCNSPLKEIVVTDTISTDARSQRDKLKVLSVAPLLGEAIKRIHENKSVSSLFII